MPGTDEVSKTKPDYRNTGIDELAGNLRTDVNTGLSAADIEKRVTRYGYNEVPEKKANPYLRFANKFWGPTAWILEAVIWTLPDP